VQVHGSGVHRQRSFQLPGLGKRRGEPQRLRFSTAGQHAAARVAVRLPCARFVPPVKITFDCLRHPIPHITAHPNIRPRPKIRPFMSMDISMVWYGHCAEACCWARCGRAAACYAWASLSPLSAVSRPVWCAGMHDRREHAQFRFARVHSARMHICQARLHRLLYAATSPRHSPHDARCCKHTVSTHAAAP
jgi:hypothetical protein